MSSRVPVPPDRDRGPQDAAALDFFPGETAPPPTTEEHTDVVYDENTVYDDPTGSMFSGRPFFFFCISLFCENWVFLGHFKSVCSALGNSLSVALLSSRCLLCFYYIPIYTLAREISCRFSLLLHKRLSTLSNIFCLSACQSEQGLLPK
jgi:hypothetical protein